MGRLRDALKVRAGEGRMAALVIGLMLATSAGGAIGGSAIEALFFSRFGVQFLPHMYVALGVISIVTSLVVGALLGRVARERLYVVLPVIIALALVAERALVATDQPWVYPLLFLAMNVMGALQGLLTWGLAGAACDTRQAKRLFPLFGAGGILGAVVGGFATRPLVELLRAENLLLVWAIALGVAFALARALVARAPARRAGRRRPTRVIDDLQQGLRTVRASPLLRWLALSVITFAILYFSIAFPFSKAATREFPDADALAGFLGLFQGASTGAAFLASLFAANRLYARFGIMTTLLTFPVLYFAGFGVLAVAAGFPLLVAFRFAQQTWLSGVAGTAYQAVFNVVPPERRDQTRAFIDGVPGQAGTILAGLVLLVGEQALEPRQLFLIGLGTAALTTFFVWRAQRAYAPALVDALRAGMPQVFFSEEEPFGGFTRDAAAVAVVVRGASDPDPAVRRVSIEILAQLGVPEAADALVRALADADPAVRAAAVRALGRAGVAAGEPAVAGALTDPDPAVRACAAAALLRASEHPRARAALRALAESSDAEARVAAYETFAELADAAGFDLVARGLADARPEVRRAAAAALPALDRDRARTPLVELLGDADPGVRGAAAEALAALGASAVPDVVAALDDERRRDGALTALARLPPGEQAPRLREFARTETRAALRYHDFARRARAEKEAGRPSVQAADDARGLLLESLRRAAERHALTALRAVGVLGDAAAMDLTIRSLASRDVAQRANAAEALESAGEREIILPLLALWEAEPATATPAADGWLAELLDDPDPWLRECAAFVHGGAEMETLATLSTMERILFLRRVPLFAELPPADLKRVAAIGDEELHPDGAVIAREGEPGDDLYIIVSGEIRVVVSVADGRDAEIARRKTGEYVGEMALITGAPRIATLVAAGDARLLRIGRAEFEAILRERPETSLAIMRVLSARLTELTAKR